MGRRDGMGNGGMESVRRRWREGEIVLFARVVANEFTP